MSAEIKICGVNDLRFAVEAERLGADYLGFIFAEESPRRVTAEFVRTVRSRLDGKVRTVGVFTVSPLPEVLAVAEDVGLDVVQLHRRAKAEEVAGIRAAGFAVWTLAGGADGDAVLFDSSHGDGERVLRKGDFRSVLAGGISEENIEAAFTSGADIVDVSGSLERSPGVKSVEKLRSFFAEVGKLKGGSEC